MRFVALHIPLNLKVYIESQDIIIFKGYGIAWVRTHCCGISKHYYIINKISDRKDHRAILSQSMLKTFFSIEIYS